MKEHHHDRVDPTSPAAARRRRGLTPAAATTAIEQACRDLRLPTVRTRFEDMLTVAHKEQLTCEGFLADLLLAECDDRARCPTDAAPTPVTLLCSIIVRHSFTADLRAFPVAKGEVAERTP